MFALCLYDVTKWYVLFCDQGILSDHFVYLSPEQMQECIIVLVGRARIFIQCSCLFAPVYGNFNIHLDNQVCSLQTLKGSSPIGHYPTIVNMTTSKF